MSQTTASYVYTGPWINWSHGLVLGSTITLNQQDGALLTAFLGIFVTTAGAACWKIMSFALHQHRSLRVSQDGIHHQQQAILRNTGSPGKASLELAHVAWSWRKHALRPFIRTLPLIALAFVNFALFGLAGIFSSEVTRAAGNETLIRSPDCGILNSTKPGSQQGVAALEVMYAQDTLAATTYSRACYGSTQNLLQCAQYPKQQLPWKVNQNATCPFTNGICIYGGSSAYEMDTGYIDSHEALGINAPKSQRVQYRKVSTCSPIHTKGYATELNDTNSSDSDYGDLLLNYNYGPLPGVSANYTYQYHVRDSDFGNGYSLTALAYLVGQATNAWYPIDALNRTDADVSLYLLAANSILYDAPVTDPFYAASTPYTNAEGTNSGYYQADQPVTALACTDQHQYCNPTNRQCTPLTSSTLAGQALVKNNIGLNQDQSVTALRILPVTAFLGTYNSVSSRGANALRASETVDELQQIQLPNTQWMTEVNTWFAVSMAKLQQKIIEYAAGPSSIPDGLSVARPLPIQEKMCKSQIVRSFNGTTSFSVLGVAIILIVGSLLISISLVLPLLVGALRHVFKWKKHKGLQWTIDSKLQMQRLAYEEAGQGSWTGGASSVPVTRENDLLGMPEGVNAHHPRLGRAWRHSDNGSAANATMERESLMGDKTARYNVEPVAAHQGYS
ncbi:hypothetical protein BDR22DRAFT_976173 [Usnea florida]